MLQSWISEPFTTRPSAYMKRLISLWLGSRWWIIILFFAIYIAASIIDERFVLVGLMIIFLVYPMLMATLCINYLLTPNARRAVLTKQVELRYPESLIITYPNTDDSDESVIPSDTIQLKQIRKVRIINGDLILILDNRKLDFIIIPMQSFGSQAMNVAKALFRIPGNF